MAESRLCRRGRGEFPMNFRNRFKGLRINFRTNLRTNFKTGSQSFSWLSFKAVWRFKNRSENRFPIPQGRLHGNLRKLLWPRRLEIDLGMNIRISLEIDLRIELKINCKNFSRFRFKVALRFKNRSTNRFKTPQGHLPENLKKLPWSRTVSVGRVETNFPQN